MQCKSMATVESYTHSYCRINTWSNNLHWALIVRRYELVLQGLMDIQPVNRVHVQQRLYEILCHLWQFQLFRELQPSEIHLLVPHVHYLFLVRGPSGKQLIRQYANAPNVDFLIVLPATQLFRTAVLQATDNSLPHAVSAYRTPKIAQLNVPLS